MSEKDLKKEGRGSYDYRTDQNTGTHLLKWFGNKCVLLGSIYSGVKALSTVQRFDLKQKKQVDVQCPDMVKDYNGSMSGVDLADMLIELYPLPRHSQSECLVAISTTLPAAEFCKQKVLVAEKIHCSNCRVLATAEQRF